MLTTPRIASILVIILTVMLPSTTVADALPPPDYTPYPCQGKSEGDSCVYRAGDTTRLTCRWQEVDESLPEYIVGRILSRSKCEEISAPGTPTKRRCIQCIGDDRR